MICPKCNGPITGYPALSRRDNKTNICNICGIAESFTDAFHGHDGADNKSYTVITVDKDGNTDSRRFDGESCKGQNPSILMHDYCFRILLAGGKQIDRREESDEGLTIILRKAEK